MKHTLRLFVVAGLFVAPVLAFAATPLPQCQITVTPSCVEAGTRAYIQWTSTNAAGGTLTTDNGTANYNITSISSLYVTPSQTTLYTATMAGPGGHGTCSVRLTVVGFGTGLCRGYPASATGGTGAASAAGGTAGSPTGGSPTSGSPTGGTSGGNTLEQTQTLGNTPTLGTTPTLPAGGGLFPTSGNTSPTPTANQKLAQNGLVPTDCQGENAATNPNCNICSIGQLIQNVINFLLGASILIAAIMFAYAGYIYFTNFGDTGRIERAHKVFKNVGVGFVIALAAWLLVQSLLGTLVGQNFFANVGGNWNTLNCSGLKRLTGVPLASWLQSSLPSLSPIMSTTPSQSVINNTNYNCPSGYELFQGSCYNSSTGDFVLPTNSNGTAANTSFSMTCDPGYTLVNSTCQDPISGDIMLPTVTGSLLPTQVGIGDCSPGSLSGTWGASATAMSCIAQNESSCDPTRLSGTDITADGNPFSVGLYQINLSANNITCPGQAPLNCPAAFSGKNYRATVADQALYQQCVSAAQNTACNTATAQTLFNSPKGIQNWSTAGKCGL